MATFTDDYVQFDIPGQGIARVLCVQIGLDWPPPPLLRIGFTPEDELIFYRSRCSSLTDEQRRAMTHVCRGAEYLPLVPDEIVLH